MNKKDKEILIRIVDSYIDEYGDNLSKVAAKRVTTSKDEQINHQNLGRLGYLDTNNGSIFNLNLDGFLKGKELKDPIGTFIRNHWKTLLPATIALVGMIGGFIGFLVSITISSCNCPN